MNKKGQNLSTNFSLFFSFLDPISTTRNDLVEMKSCDLSVGVVHCIWLFVMFFHGWCSGLMWICKTLDWVCFSPIWCHDDNGLCIFIILLQIPDSIICFSFFLLLALLSNFFFFHFQRDSNIDDEITKFVQPQVIGVGELYDLDSLHIVCEGKMSCTLPQTRIADAIIALLGSFYVFNIVYKEGKNILSFLEHILFGVGRGQTRVSVNSFINEIANA